MSTITYMFKRGDIFKVSEYFTSTTLQHNGFVGRGELFSAKGFLLGFLITVNFQFFILSKYICTTKAEHVYELRYKMLKKKVRIFDALP